MKDKLFDSRPVPSIKEMFRQAAEDSANEIAYKFRRGDEVVEVSYATYYEDTLALGEALNELGVSGTHIAMTGPNSYDWIVVYLTALQSSGAFVPIDKDLPEEDFLNVLTDSDSAVIFYTEKHADILTRHAEELTAIRYFVGIGCKGEGERFLSYEELCKRGRALRAAGTRNFEGETRDPMLLKMLVYTSGTTGISKGVMLSEHNLCSSIHYGTQRCTHGKNGLSVLPYHHVYEAVCGILVAIQLRSTVAINENLRTVSKNLGFYKPDYVYLVPAFVEVFYKKIWANIEKQGKTGLIKTMIAISNGLRKVGIDLRRKLFAKIHESFGGNLVQLVCGGAPVRAELGDFFDSIGIELYNGYGITECSPLVSVNTPWLNDCSTVGLPLPCCEIRLDGVNAEGDGEICVKGDIVMMGYYKRPDLTEEVLTSDGWFHTGDYGRITKKGQLKITGRKKNLIVLSNGKNIFPEEQEGYIQQIPYVAEVIVFGIRDSHGQEDALGAEVFLNAEAVKEMGITDPAATLKKDIDRVLAHLPTYKHMSKIYIRDVEFVKTTSNKIKRSSLLYRDAASAE